MHSGTALQRLRQEDHKFEANLGYISERLSKTNQTNKKGNRVDSGLTHKS
jgi:hypothetical protein